MASLSNGHAAEEGNRSTGASTSQSRSRRRSRLQWTIGLVVRIVIWYSIITPFFRCPSHISELTLSSPSVCKTYLYARSFVEPYVHPYYDVYAAPYVETARPYVHVLNEKVYTPVSNIARQSYDKYGAPALDHVQQYGEQQWQSKVVPHIQTAKDKASAWYEAQVGAHVRRVTAVVSPYHEKLRHGIWVTVDGYILPFCAKYQPFIGKTYSSGQEILATRVLPYAQNAWSSAIYIVNNSLWPKISSLYSENVEPQLVKIGQKLASYREGKRLRQVVEDVDNSLTDHSTTSSSVVIPPSFTEPFTTSTMTEATPTPSLSPTELAAQTREKITSDLEIWQQRFAAAADKGIEDLERRVQEIVESYLTSGIKADGEKLVESLESAVEDQTSSIKHDINALIEALPYEEAPQKEAAAVEELSKLVRTGAVSLRDRAHALREWRNSAEEELLRRVSTAVSFTLAVLDDVRDLGLQEIGMRWAWMDGVTYKDWETYHTMKAQFEDWKEQFRNVGLQHAKLRETVALTEDILSRGMDVAEAAAKELARLKDVCRWKIAAREVSDDFGTRSEPPPPLPKPAYIPKDDSHEDEKMLNNQSDGNTESESQSEALANEHNRNGEDDLTKTNWGASAAEVSQPYDENENYIAPAKFTHNEAVQNLLSELLIGKDAAYIETLLRKLNAIYDTPRAEPESSSTPTSSVEDQSTAAESIYATNPLFIDHVLEIVDEQLQSAVDEASYEDAYASMEQDIIEDAELTTSTDDHIVIDSSTPDYIETTEQQTEFEDGTFDTAFSTKIADDFEELTSTITSTATETVKLEEIDLSDGTEDMPLPDDL